MLNRIIKFFLENRLVTAILLVIFIGWGLATAPFDWNIGFLPNDPVPVDAIPDLGENQQIVYTEWMGRSPQDIEDQITYPLTTALLGIPGVQTIRSSSIFGLSSIYIIFDEDTEFYWSRSRIIEKLNSLPQGALPVEVKPSLGPDATALGQIYWYTLEGRDENGSPAGGWDPQELRTIQDFYVGYSLMSAGGVSEVAAIGGYVKEYQVDIDPDAMKAHNVDIADIMSAVQNANLDVGAKTMEVNRSEYFIRGLGYVKKLSDLEEAVVKVNENVPIRVKDVARVQFGPEIRRGGLDKEGSEAVGGVVVARYGSNPLEVINNVKKKIKEIAAGLPSKKLADGSVSKVTIVPFYDRTGLIKETLGTLETALSHEILISILVVIVLVLNLRASIIISSLLPIGVLTTFILMKYFQVDANIVALSGIAIAIGVMVDVGIIITENIVRHLESPKNIGVKGKKLVKVIYKSTTEVAPAVVTALTTTIISFLPVFAMQAAEGKLFKPLAFTKTFAILSSLAIGILIIPTLANWIFSIKLGKSKTKVIWNLILLILGIFILVFYIPWAGIVLIALAANNLASVYLPKYNNSDPERIKKITTFVNTAIIIFTVSYFLAMEWLPLGPSNSLLVNYIFVLIIVGTILGVLGFIMKTYPIVLRWCLDHKLLFLSIPISLLLLGLLSWQGFNNIFGFISDGTDKIGLDIKHTSLWNSMTDAFPGLGKEFMPSLDEGSFLLMPTTMPHSGVEENIDVIRKLDKNVTSIPEVESVVGKWGRANSALDPAPISMFENVINYKPEYELDENGHRIRFKVDNKGNFIRDGNGNLLADAKGKYFRNWREHIKTSDDIWSEIVKASKIPGMTSAPKLQPIQTRLIMLQTGMRAPMGIKVFGPDLQTIEDFALKLEKILQDVPGIESNSVFADRVVGKPYIEIKPDRREMARYGLTMKDMQHYIEVAIGGIKLTTTVEGRERFPVRVRYAREYRDDPREIENILIPTKSGVQIPLGQLTKIEYAKGPQMIKSEDTFLDAYVIFDKKPDIAEVDVVERAQRFISEEINSGKLEVPAGVTYRFTGNYENQLRATKRLSLVIPISLITIFLILYFQFRSIQVSAMVFIGVFVAFAGGFIMIWLYGQDWFMNLSIAGQSMRMLFQVNTINLSVAVWVGFIALFGVATDDGVLMGTYINQVFDDKKPKTKEQIKKSVLIAGKKRVRPAVMTTATTLIALLPVLSSTGKGSDIMAPMAIPIFGGMLIQTMTMFIVPVLYSSWQERKILNKSKNRDE